MQQMLSVKVTSAETPLHSLPHSISDACSGFGGNHVQVGALVEVLHAGEHPDCAFPYPARQSRASKDKAPVCKTWEGDGIQNCRDNLLLFQWKESSEIMMIHTATFIQRMCI